MYLKIYNTTSFSGHYFLILMFQLFDQFAFQTPILIHHGMNVPSVAKFHKKEEQRNQILKPLRIFEGLRQLPKSVNMEVAAS